MLSDLRLDQVLPEVAQPQRADLVALHLSAVADDIGGEDRNAGAQNNIGLRYAQGRDGAQDYAEAMRWYRKAADQGNAAAQINIGLLYANGLGVARDLQQEREWMQKAAAGGDERAKKWLTQH